MKKRGSTKKRSSAQKVLMVFIAIFLVILVALAVVMMRDIFSNSPEDDPDSNIINHPTDPDDPDNPAGPDDPVDPDDDDYLDHSPDPVPPPTPDPDANLDGTNPLTGVPMDSRFDRNRPIAIVVNNLNEAFRINGISEADIVYEYLVEGGLTRMLALYQDVFYVEKIGSIRSARHYTVQLANAYDAILVAAGRSPQAQAEVRALGIPFLNEVEGPHREIFFRDRNRIPGRRVENLHSVVTTGARLFQWLPQYDFRIVHEDNYEPSLRFVENGTPNGGSTANDIRMRFSAVKSTTFIYNSADNVYRVRQNNEDFTDANNNARAVFTNIIFIKTSVTGLQGDDAHRLEIVTTGSGTGYFANGGRYIPILWSRDNKSSQFIFTREDGTPLDFGVGKTYICIIPRTHDPVFG